MVAQEPATTGEVVAALHPDERILVACHVGLHAPELIDTEQTTIASDPLLTEEGRTSILQTDDQIAYQEEW